MPAFKPRARRTALFAAGVLLLHAAMLWLLVRNAGAPRAPTEPTRVLLRLLPWPEPEPAVRPSAEPAEHAQGRAITLPQAITPRATRTPAFARPAASTSTPLAAAPAAPSAGPAASQAERPLDLALPRGYSTRPGARHPALDDPRANSAVPRVGERMAATLGTDSRLVGEPLADGRRRLRQGADCVLVTPSRNRQLFPFDDSAQRTPSLVEPCP